MQHDAGMLRGYLVAGVEDPRLNVQSVLSRHFLTRALTGGRYGGLMEAEYRFAAAMNWLTALAGRMGEAGELESVLHALRRGADNAEGVGESADGPCGRAGIGIVARGRDIDLGGGGKGTDEEEWKSHAILLV